MSFPVKYRIATITFLQVILILNINAQTVIPGGIVSGTWEPAGSPYWIDGDIYIPADSTLNIGPGVEILFRGHYKLDVFGHLHAAGSSGDSVFFSASDTAQGWKGIRLYAIVQPDPDSARMEYCKFSYAKNENQDANGSALYAENSTRVSIQHCTFSNCSAFRGGAVFLKNSPLLFKHAVFKDNEAEEKGGAVYLENSSAKLIDIQITKNQAQVGGGLYLYNSDAEIINSMISENTSIGGGGGLVLHKDSDALVEGTEINYNTAGGSGGGIAVLEDCSPLFSRCSVSFNKTVKDDFISRGGGIFVAEFGNSLVFKHCTFEGNESDEDGGAIYTDDDTELINCLVINNKATLFQGFGGGAVHFGLTDNLVLNCTFSNNEAVQGSTFYVSGGTVNVYNSIIWDDEQASQSMIYLHNFLSEPSFKIYFSTVREGIDAVGATGNFNLIWGEGNQEDDPLFVDPLNNFELEMNSPAVDAGLVDSLALIIPSTDLKGNPRISGYGIDLGAYEFYNPVRINDFIAGESQEYAVYPNPFRNKIFIDMDRKTGQDLVLSVLNMSGERIYHGIIGRAPAEGTFSIDLSSFPAGLYFISIRSGASAETRKIIKIK